MAGLVEEGDMSLMLITHDLAVLAGLSSEIAVMQAGQVVESGATETLFRSHRHAYTAKLAASNHQPARLPVRAKASRLLHVHDLHVGYQARRSFLSAKGR